jgi:exopolysaccharide production protein ExoZ
MTSPRPDTSGVLTNIQALRALAALLVVLYHLKDMIAAIGIPQHYLAFAALGVDLFFVVSGFIMVFTTDRSPTTGPRFLGNRIARVAPLYWAMTLLVFAIAVIAPSVFRNTDPAPLDLLRSLAFIPYARPDGAMMPLLFLGWSLNYEMFFYVIFAAALMVSRGRHHVLLCVLVIIVLVAIGLTTRVSPSSPFGFYTNSKMLEFAAGMLIARALDRLPSNRTVALFGMAVGLGGLFATPLLFVGVSATLSATVFCSIIVLSALSAERGGSAIRWPLLIVIGDASYSLYLIHPFITQAATKAWQVGGGSPGLGMIVLPLAMVAATGAAIIVYRRVEVPLSKAARRLLNVRRQAVPARGL